MISEYCSQTVTERDRWRYGRAPKSRCLPVCAIAVAGRVGVGVVAGSRVITVRVGDAEIEAEAVVVAGTEPTSGAAGRAAANVLGAFGKAQEAIIEVARSTAQMIEKAGRRRGRTRWRWSSG
jgi:hypothetical protein